VDARDGARSSQALPEAGALIAIVASTNHKETTMVTYIVLANFTEQGARSIRDTTKRAEQVKELGVKFGVNMKNIYWTQGQYDLVTYCEAENEDQMAAFGLAITSSGNVRMQPMRAFTKDEMNGILSKLG
jgi:uncharacterized protein with GYD domain